MARETVERSFINYTSYGLMYWAVEAHQTRIKPISATGHFLTQVICLFHESCNIKLLVLQFTLKTIFFQHHVDFLPFYVPIKFLLQ